MNKAKYSRIIIRYSGALPLPTTTSIVDPERTQVLLVDEKGNEIELRVGRQFNRLDWGQKQERPVKKPLKKNQQKTDSELTGEKFDHVGFTRDTGISSSQLVNALIGSEYDGEIDETENWDTVLFNFSQAIKECDPVAKRLAIRQIAKFYKIVRP